MFAGWVMGACDSWAVLCVAQEFFETIIAFVITSAVEFWAILLAKWPAVAAVIDTILGLLQSIFQIAGQRIQAIASLAALSFGLWKWWSNREAKVIVTCPVSSDQF